MVDKNSPIFIACRPTGIIAIFLFVCIGMLLTTNASATFGNGSDGDVTISSSTTLTSDMNYNSLTINAGITLYPDGYAIYVADTLTLNGAIARNGNSGGAGSAGSYNGPAGSPGSGGSALPTRSVGGSASGGAGGYGSASGSGSSGTSGGGISHGIAGSSGSSGSSGSTSTNSGGSGGSGGSTANTHTVTSDNIGDIFTFASTRKGGAAGGGGGGGSWTFSGSFYLSGGGGGGGGSGGGVVFIAANTIVGTGSVCANGGSGGSGGGSGGPYGGSGGSGGGGAVVIAYNEYSLFTGSVCANGGSGGDIFWIYSAIPEYVYWDQSSYSNGDAGSMIYTIAEYDSGSYDYSIDIFEGSSFMSYCHLSSSEGNASYTFSGVVKPVTYYAKLTKRVKGSSIPLVITTDSCTVGPSDVSIVFDQSIYGPDDLVSISYYNCPNGSKIILQDDVTPHQVSTTWVDISGNGSVSYQLSNADANRVFYAKIYSVSNIVLASDSMQIDDTLFGYCHVYGGIYDSQDYHPLIGTVFIGDSYSDVVGYDEYGSYSIIVPWGTYDVSAVVSSYLTYNISNVVISGSDYDLNMFLSVNDTTTHVFRGSVTNADTNAVVDGVLVHVYNDTFDEYDFTSQSGVWVVNGLTSGANYTLHATKDDYHSYTYSFMYDPGDFYHNFMMSSVVVEDDDIEDVLGDDESMTEYFDNKFREFAPTAWGIFLLSVVLWLMAILTSFGGSNKRR